MTNLNDFTIIGPTDAPKHPMWSKMWQRAGLDPGLALSRFKPINQGASANSPIITLGEQALRYITGEQDLFRWRGRQVQRQQRLIYPTLEPSQMLPRMVNEEDDDESWSAGDLQRAPARFQGVWVWDIQQALKQGNELRQPPSFAHYIVDPHPAAWKTCVDRLKKGRLSFDIETAYKMAKMNDEDWEAQGLKDGQILRISFCNEVGYSVSVSWTAKYWDGIFELLVSEQDKICWNGFIFDVPRLEADGHKVNGRICDYMDGFHMVESDLPKGLEWVTSFYTTFQPWKHLSQSNAGLYSCIDADAAYQNALGIDKELEHFGMTHLFEEHVIELMPYLKEAGIRGNAIDLQYSHELEDEMVIHRDHLIIEAQPLIPRELLPRKRVKTLPDAGEWDEVWLPGVRKFCTHCQLEVSNKTEHFKGGKKNNPCKAAAATLEERPTTIREFDVLLPWNPNSADQIKAYINHFKHPMGKNRATDQPSANSKHLEKLVKKYGHKHPIYKLVVEFKKVSKTISTYVYHNYCDSRGHIHSTYVNGPSTWRLAARDLNLTNVGKRETNPWAKRARRQIVARDGYVFVDADSTSIEAVIVGYLIGDKEFLKMAGKSIHAWLVCQELGWDFNDETMNKVKKEQKDLYNKMKTAIYLLLYGGDPYLMHMENPETFPTRQDAQIVQDKIFALIPKLKEWQERTRDRAKKEGVLTAVWGYRHSFYDVYTFKRDKWGEIQYGDHQQPEIKLGKDGKRSLAFEPQNTAASFGRDTLNLIGRSKFRQYMCANVFVHDGYTLEVPLSMKDEAEQFLVDTLTRPVAQLGGLRIGCESGFGFNWADVDSEKKFWADGNPNGMRTIRKVEC